MYWCCGSFVEIANDISAAGKIKIAHTKPQWLNNNFCFSIQAHLTVIPCQTGQLHITAIKYSLTSVAINGPVDEKFSVPAAAASAMTTVSMLGRLDLVLKGPRLNNTKAEKTSVVHGLDNRLNLDVVAPMPLLEVMSFLEVILLSLKKIIRNI